jgi:hypothetical protein
MREIKEIDVVFSCRLATYDQRFVLDKRSEILDLAVSALNAKILGEAIVSDARLEMKGTT